MTGASGGSFFVSQLSVDGQGDPRFGVHGTRFGYFPPGAPPGGMLVRGASTVVGGSTCCAIPTLSMELAELAPGGAVADVVKVGLPKRLGAGKPKGIADVIAGPKGSTFVVGSAKKGTFVAKYLGSGRPDKSFRDGGFALVRGLQFGTRLRAPRYPRPRHRPRHPPRRARHGEIPGAGSSRP